MGIRALELARTLRAEFDVRLIVGNDPSEAASAAGDVPVVAAAPGALAAAAVNADAAVVSGHAANWWYHQVPDVPVAADLYDPFFVENLHYAATLGESTSLHDRATLDLALGRADFFLCASAEQRLFYAGALYAAGRVGPRNFPTDPTLQGLLAVVPFGAPRRQDRVRPGGRDDPGVVGSGRVGALRCCSAPVRRREGLAGGRLAAGRLVPGGAHRSGKAAPPSKRGAASLAPPSR